MPRSQHGVWLAIWSHGLPDVVLEETTTTYVCWLIHTASARRYAAMAWGSFPSSSRQLEEERHECILQFADNDGKDGIIWRLVGCTLKQMIWLRK